MKLTFLILFIFFHSGENLFAQNIFDIKADLVGIQGNNLNFYKKTKDNQYERFQVSLKLKNDSNWAIKKINSFITVEPKYQDEIIKVDDLLDYKPNKLRKEIINNSFITKINKADSRNRYDILLIFESYNKQNLFSLEHYELRYLIDPETNQKIEKWNFVRRTFTNYYFLRINRKKVIVVFTDADYDDFYKIAGFIFPLNSKDIAIKGFSKESFREIKNADLDSLMLEKIDLNSKTKNWEDLYKISADFKLQNRFNQNLINKKFDTLSMKNGFIIGKREDKISIYNDKLIDISPLNLRAAFINDNGYCQVLVNNEIKWLSSDGILSNDFIAEINGVCGFVSNYDYDIIKEDGNYIFKLSIRGSDGENSLTKLKLFPVSKFDEVYFLNKSTHLSYNANSYITKEGINSLIVSKNRKFGLLEYNIVSQQNKVNGNIDTSFKFKTILDLIYDEIIFFNYYQPILLRKGQLYGYNGLNAEPKYKSIEEFIVNFAKFTLPNNGKGWLDKNGVEYLDY